MEDEYDIEVLEHLEEITRITFLIKEVYDKLLYLEIHKKDIFDYEERKKALIDELVIYKTSESEEYEFFMDDYTKASSALDFLEELVNDNMSEESKLCFDRINGKMSWIEIFQGINQDPEVIYNEYLSNWKRFQILLKNGLSMEEAFEFHADYYTIMDESISFRFVSFIEDEISCGERTSDFLRMKYEEAFTCANSLEDYLIMNSFAPVKKNFAEELRPNYPIDPNIRRKYVLSQMKDLTLELINKLNNTRDDFKIARLILLFKTYILYYEKKDLKMLIGNVNAMVNNKDIAELLIDFINHQDYLLQNQNRDTNGIQFK